MVYAAVPLALLALSPFALATPQVVRHVFPRQDPAGNGTNLTPIVFFNLTIGEFQEQLRNHYGLPPLLNDGKPTVPDNDPDEDYNFGGIGNGTVVDFRRKRSAGPIVERDVVGGESNNDPVSQGVVNRRNADCNESFGSPYRARYGNCNARWPKTMDIFCGLPGQARSRRSTTRTCAQDETCNTLRAHNFLGNIVNFPYCGKTITTLPEGHNIDPIYEGYKGLPTETWSPGTYNDYFSIVDSIPDLTATFDYRGHWSNGDKFSSKGRGHSWSCINCPAGRLYIDTVGIRLTALGFSYPSLS